MKSIYYLLEIKRCPFVVFLKDVSLYKQTHLIISKVLYPKFTEVSLETFFSLQ